MSNKKIEKKYINGKYLQWMQILKIKYTSEWLP